MNHSARMIAKLAAVRPWPGLQELGEKVRAALVADVDRASPRQRKKLLALVAEMDALAAERARLWGEVDRRAAEREAKRSPEAKP